MIKYTQVEGEEGVFSKTGHSHEFTTADVLQHEMRLEKEIKQATAQKELEEAKMTNVANNNPELIKMSDEDMHAIFLYWDAKVLADECAAAITAREEALAEYAEVKEAVKEQTGIEIV
jgi:exo-beta-1,3-glucanase (GH17 family)